MPNTKIEWTKEMEAYLLSHYEVMSLYDMGMHLGISVPSVSKKLHLMGIMKDRGGKSRVWSEEELVYLREHYPFESMGDIADALKISPVMVRRKVLELGLKKSADYDPRKYYCRYVRSYKNNTHKVIV